VPSPGREAFLEGPVLGATGLIDDEAAYQAGSRPGGGTEPSIPADRTKNRTDSCAGGGAGERPLLRRSHVGTGNHRQSESGEHQELFHPNPRASSIQRDDGQG
jgi:hypothetical protein